jgi:hypothetical protein
VVEDWNDQAILRLGQLGLIDEAVSRVHGAITAPQKQEGRSDSAKS